MIDEIRDKIMVGHFEFSRHAVDQSIRRNITVEEIREAIAAGEIIEHYPGDKYGASCLVFGTTAKMRPIHVQCSHPSRDLIKIITVYEPDPALWIGFKQRAPK